MPQLGQVLGQGHGFLALGGIQHEGRLLPDAVAFTLEPIEFLELRVPIALERPRHQAILGLDLVIAPSRPLAAEALEGLAQHFPQPAS